MRLVALEEAVQEVQFVVSLTGDVALLQQHRSRHARVLVRRHEHGLREARPVVTNH